MMSNTRDASLALVAINMHKEGGTMGSIVAYLTEGV